MSSRLAALSVFVLAMLAVAPAAAGDGPMPYVSQLGSGVLTPDGTTRFVAVPGVTSTLLEQIQVDRGEVQRFTELPGSWGVPVVTYSEDKGEGLSADGRTLVLGDTATSYPRRTTMFVVIGLPSLHVLRTISLRGDFAYDAMSPDARRLYLIQFVGGSATQRYVVRQYDLARGRLLPGRIADRTQKGWIMQGYPQGRATSADGRWVYTLYQHPGGYPFVHALDTVRGVAHCIGLPWGANQSGFWNMRVSLRNNERTLAVHWLSGRPWLAVDTSTWRISRDHRAGFPWLPAGAGAAAAVLLAVVGAFLLRRSRRGRRSDELDEELEELLAEAEGTLLTPTA